MNSRDEAYATLLELLPGIDPDVIDYLLALEAPPGAFSERWQWCLDTIIYPLADLMLRLRFNDAKLARVSSYCNLAGGRLLKSAYFYYKQRRQGRAALELETMLRTMRTEERTAQREDREPDYEAAADIANQLNAKVDGEPLRTFNVDRALLARSCERALRRKGVLTDDTDLHRGMQMVSNLVNKVENDKAKRSPEEFLHLVPPRRNSPNVIFPDGRFGDGSRLVEVKLPDGRVVKRRDYGVDAVIPAFVGLSRIEQDQMIRQALEERRARM